MIETAPISPCCAFALNATECNRLVEMSKALGNPQRFEILKYLLTHPGCITGDLAVAAGLAQSTTSQHLKVLRESGWIRGEVDGPAVCYCIDPKAAAWFHSNTAHLSPEGCAC